MGVCQGDRRLQVGDSGGELQTGLQPVSPSVGDVLKPPIVQVDIVQCREVLNRLEHLCLRIERRKEQDLPTLRPRG